MYNRVECYVQRVEEEEGEEKASESSPCTNRSPHSSFLRRPLAIHMLMYNALFSIPSDQSPHNLSHSRKRHLLLDLRDRLARVQALGADAGAVEDGVASVQTHAVVQHGFALGLVLVAGVGEPAVGCQQDGGAEVFFAVPPVGGAGGGAAGAEDAFVETVELFAVRGCLAVFTALGEEGG